MWFTENTVSEEIALRYRMFFVKWYLFSLIGKYTEEEIV
jgi:hypothetical protein